MKKNFATMCLTLLIAAVVMTISCATAFAAINNKVDVGSSAHEQGVRSYNTIMI